MKLYTFKAEVPLGPNQHIAFAVGKGYYAAEGNPSPFVKPPPKPIQPTLRERLVHWANWGMIHNAHFSYTQGSLRRQMYHRAPGDSSGVIFADCSQFYSAIGHWCGIKALTDTDYTGTLLTKGRKVTAPQPGDCVIWGPGTGTHAAMFVGDGYTIGFGHSPGAPNRVKLADMTAWMVKHGHPGVNYRSFV